MESRGHESPMDFQWEGSGPGDPNSPFRMSPLGSSLSQDTQQKKPPQTFLFNTPNRPAPPVFRAPSFTTPRNLPTLPSKTSDIFSTPFSPSGPDTPDTPEVESEAPTPEPPRSSRATKATPSKSLVFTSPTRLTGRGELKRGRFCDGAIYKIRRRRTLPQRFERDFWMSGGAAASDGEEDGDGDEDDEDDDEEGRGTPLEEMSTPRRWGRRAKSAAAQWVQTHRDIPLIASHYLQLFFNLSLILLLLYAVFCFYLTIRRDVDQKVEEYSAEIIQEMSICAKEYVENRCDPNMRVPAMEIRCSAWERCMNRDPSQIGRAKVSAETFAEILNSFIEPISYKTMFFCLLVVFGGLLVSNFAFGFFRAKTLNHPAPYIAAVAPPMADHWSGHPQLPQQQPYRSIPGTPLPSTPARNTGYHPAPGRTPTSSRRDLQWR